jgi:hypothetical protein
MTDASGNTDTIDPELKAAAQFTDALDRVAFEPGMMIGASALSTEQAYHLRRLSRFQRWLVGPGTVFGMRVDAIGSKADPADVLLQVTPGYGIDSLGREVQINQTWAISLRDWITANKSDSSVTSALQAGNLLLRVTIRARACPHLLQPVAAEMFDTGLDPVAPARIGDSFLLELLAEKDPKNNPMKDVSASPFDLWSPPVAPTPLVSDPQPQPSAREQAMIDAADASSKDTLKLQKWLLSRTLPPFDDSPGTSAALEEAARLLLASVHVTLADLNAPPTLAGILVNNLVRPFVRPHVLLAAFQPPLPQGA